MNITAIPAFNDNYIWLLDDNKHAWVVDPGDAKPVLTYLENKKLHLEGVLITHHHLDHVGGVKQLQQAFNNVVIYGPLSPHITIERSIVNESRLINILGYEFNVICTPGHTLDHIVYYCGLTVKPVLFCGDTLFAGGCGRLFEGTSEQMLNSLEKLSALPDETLVYCAHEYTMANLHFAAMVEPENIDISNRMTVEQNKRDKQQPTIPSSIALEKKTNPFLRCTHASVISSARKVKQNITGTDTVFAAIREWKDIA